MVMPPRPAVSEKALARVGTLVRQKYTIRRLLGMGGMAVVYAASQRDGRPVALKFMLEIFRDEPDACALDVAMHDAARVRNRRTFS